MPLDEIVDVVDEEDKPVGTATIRECLRSGLLHRAVAVQVFRPGGGALLQKRSLSDPWHPGRWTLSCTGHVRAGESYPEAARRELSEELGLAGRVRPVAKMLLPKIRSHGHVEWEHVTLFSCQTDRPVTPDPVEVAEVRLLLPRDVRKMLNGRRLTPDARLLLAEFFRLRDNPGSGRSL